MPKAAAPRKPRRTIPQATIKRLRSQRDALDADWQDGYAAGQRWATEKAHVSHLLEAERLSKAIGEYEDAWEENFKRVADWDPAEELYLDLIGQSADDAECLPNGKMKRQTGEHRAAAMAFWRDVLGKDAGRIDTGDFARGFLEGLLAFWKTAKRRVKPGKAVRRAS
jgi:hypothetical protein